MAFCMFTRGYLAESLSEFSCDFPPLDPHLKHGDPNSPGVPVFERWKSRDLPLTKKTQLYSELMLTILTPHNSSNSVGYLLPIVLLTPMGFLVPFVLPRFFPNFRWFKTHGRTTTFWCLNPNSLICEHIFDISNLHFSMIASESLRCFKFHIFHGFTIRP